MYEWGEKEEEEEEEEIKIYNKIIKHTSTTSHQLALCFVRLTPC